MPKQALESLTESMFYLLMALTQGERCGTEITAFAAEITAGRVKIGPATLYTLLGKFEKEGLIAETSVLGCKRYYQITPAGLLAYWLVTFWVRYAMGVWHTPVIDFVELGWLSFCYLGLLAAALVSVVHNTVLLYRFSARLTRGAEPERHKNWRKGAGRYLVGRVLAALLFVLTIVWTFAGSAMEKSRHGSIPLEDYTAPLPFATLDDYAGQPTALDADAAPAASFVLVQRLPLAPTFIKYEAHGQAGANGLRGALYVEYYECITPQLAQTMYREGKTNGLHNFPETAADAANGFIYCRTLVDSNKVLRVLLFQYQEEQIPLQELEAICKSGFAASGEST